MSGLVENHLWHVLRQHPNKPRADSNFYRGQCGPIVSADLMSSTTFPDSSPGAGQWFATTHWSVVLAAGGRHAETSVAALDLLCRRYWPPIYAFIQRKGFAPADAQDLTQAFFTRLLEKNSFEVADASKGKFRTFLLTALTRFLVNEWERSQTQKRGAGALHLPLDFEAEDRHRWEPAASETPETIYERRWVEALLAGVLARLRAEYESAGEPERFEILKPFLVAERAPPSGAEVAAQLGLTESAAYSAVHRLRKRYAEILREETAHTVDNPDQVEDELRYLAQVLSR